MSGMGHTGMSMGHAGSGMGRGTGMGHPMAFSHAGFGVSHAGRFARGRHFAFRHHRFFRNRVAFVGGYGYDDCYTRVWTRWGWRWIYACY
jgi:hypothetical protein